MKTKQKSVESNAESRVFCLVCMTSGRESDIVAADEQGMQINTTIVLYQEMYQQVCGTLLLKDDPKSICLACCNELLRAYTFCLKSKSGRNQWKQQTKAICVKLERSNDFAIERVKEEPDFAEKILSEPLTAEWTVARPQYPCRLCNSFVGATIGSMAKHYQEKHPNTCAFNCPFCDLIFSRISRFVRHGTRCEKRPFLDKLYRCSLCNILVPSLDTHNDCHHRHLKLYTCDICAGRFACKRELSLHINRLHVSRLFTCPKCGTAFLKHWQMVRHIRNEHGKLFRCHHCSYESKRKQDLLVHVMRHSGKRDYACDKCSATFVMLEHLQTHNKQYHTVDVLRSCQLCGQLFESRRTLVKHLATHREPG